MLRMGFRENMDMGAAQMDYRRWGEEDAGAVRSARYQEGAGTEAATGARTVGAVDGVLMDSLEDMGVADTRGAAVGLAALRIGRRLLS